MSDEIARRCPWCGQDTLVREGCDERCTAANCGYEVQDKHFPTPGPNPPVPSWDEYERLEQALHDYLDHKPPDPAWQDVWRAIGAILGEYQRDAFIQAFDLAEPAETPCIRRLITGEDECPHEPLMADADPDGPPHAPPARDHATLWLDSDGDPALYSIHVYPGNIELLEADAPPYNQWFDLVEFARHWGLELSILPKSWYNIGSAVHIALRQPERFRGQGLHDR